jgi:galactokinase
VVSLAQLSEQRFAQTFGRRAEGEWAAPGRVNLIGEYTDVNGGHVLPLAIAQSTTVLAARRDDGRLRLSSAQQPGGPVDVGLQELADGPIGAADPTSASARPAWVAYPVAVARALFDAGYQVGGADIFVHSEVPVGAGLSSSAALECAVALALSDLYGTGLHGMELAVVAQRAENDYVGMPCGLMDQAASMCCTAGHALLLDTRDRTVRQVPLDVAGHGYALVIMDTHVKHSLVTSAYVERRRSCEEAAAALGVAFLRDAIGADLDEALATVTAKAGQEAAKRARHVLTEEVRVSRVVDALDDGDLVRAGACLVEGHLSLRDDFEVSCPELDLAVETALASGALGARLTGAGFGGSAVALVPRDAGPFLTASLGSEFARRGWRPPSTLFVTPSPGARRIS